ncbi:AbrB/MazE/SpoVT family DNA-binding domain-containing protein [Candidatus Woesearchaeota archaeon]|nr:AbrB/MazE/SpoVT family DNA-binding domain-containing protein [Candidatus Woesearchaeota archaeon]
MIKRQIFTWGGYSFGITLPKNWVKRNDVSQVEIEEFDQELIIRIAKNDANTGGADKC